MILLAAHWLIFAAAFSGLTCARPPPPVEDCDWATGDYDRGWNHICKQRCLDQTESFWQDCRIEKYEIVGDEVRPLGTCFSNWVPGYGDDDLVPTGVDPGYLIAGTLKTAQDCQQLCQSYRICVWWQFRAVVESGMRYGQCFLKEWRHVEGALRVVPSQLNANDLPFCPVLKANKFCNESQGNCIQCHDDWDLPFAPDSPTEKPEQDLFKPSSDRKPRCVRRSKAIISGPRHCGYYAAPNLLKCRRPPALTEEPPLVTFTLTTTLPTIATTHKTAAPQKVDTFPNKTIIYVSAAGGAVVAAATLAGLVYYALHSPKALTSVQFAPPPNLP